MRDGDSIELCIEILGCSWTNRQTRLFLIPDFVCQSRTFGKFLHCNKTVKYLKDPQRYHTKEHFWLVAVAWKMGAKMFLQTYSFISFCILIYYYICLFSHLSVDFRVVFKGAIWKRCTEASSRTFFFASYFLTTFRFIFYLDENILGSYRILKFRGLSFFPGDCTRQLSSSRALRRWPAASATLGEKSNKTVFYPKEMAEVLREWAFWHFLGYFSFRGNARNGRGLQRKG